MISEGPIGGPSFIRGFYRPEISYSTGVGIKSVIKANFPSGGHPKTEAASNVSDSEEESFICLVEKGGISMFAENGSESFVIYMPEFQIEGTISCKYGLLVVPVPRGPSCEGDEDRFLYVLTHPIKQVSKISQKCGLGSGKLKSASNHFIC